MVGLPTSVPGFTVIRFNNLSLSMFLPLTITVLKIILYFVPFSKRQTDDFGAQSEWPESAHVVGCDLYYKYSVMYHLEGLPPVCLLHRVDDPDGLAVRTGELSPCSQSVELAEQLEFRSHPYEFYAYCR